jgi:hypothetical protein
MFDTLSYAKKLEDVGVTREQAEVHVQIIAEIVEGELTTKQDLKILETNLEGKMQQLEYRLIVRLSTIVGAMITLAIAVTTAVAKIL